MSMVKTQLPPSNGHLTPRTHDVNFSFFFCSDPEGTRSYIPTGTIHTNTHFAIALSLFYVAEGVCSLPRVCSKRSMNCAYTRVQNNFASRNSDRAYTLLIMLSTGSMRTHQDRFL